MKTKLLILFILANFSAGAQHASIKFSPFAMLEEGNFPALQAGVEYRLSKKFSLYNEIGFRYRKGVYEYADTVFGKYHGIKAKVELRYYINSDEDEMTGKYIAANIFYTNSTHNTTLNYYKNKDSSDSRYDAILVKKNVLGLNVLVGSQLVAARHFLIDIYAGLGIRIRFINTKNMEYNADNDVLVKWRHPNINDMRHKTDSENGTSAAPNLTLGIRVGWRF